MVNPSLSPNRFFHHLQSARASRQLNGDAIQSSYVNALSVAADHEQLCARQMMRVLIKALHFASQAPRSMQSTLWKETRGKDRLTTLSSMQHALLDRSLSSHPCAHGGRRGHFPTRSRDTGNHLKRRRTSCNARPSEGIQPDATSLIGDTPLVRSFTGHLRPFHFPENAPLSYVIRA